LGDLLFFGDGAFVLGIFLGGMLKFYLK